LYRLSKGRFHIISILSDRNVSPDLDLVYRIC
jgi:hypothetical protein